MGSPDWENAVKPTKVNYRSDREQRGTISAGGHLALTPNQDSALGVPPQVILFFNPLRRTIKLQPHDLLSAKDSRYFDVYRPEGPEGPGNRTVTFKGFFRHFGLSLDRKRECRVERVGNCSLVLYLDEHPLDKKASGVRDQWEEYTKDMYVTYQEMIASENPTITKQANLSLRLFQDEYLNTPHRVRLFFNRQRRAIRLKRCNERETQQEQGFVISRSGRNKVLNRTVSLKGFCWYFSISLDRVRECRADYMDDGSLMLYLDKHPLDQYTRGGGLLGFLDGDQILSVGEDWEEYTEDKFIRPDAREPRVTIIPGRRNGKVSQYILDYNKLIHWYLGKPTHLDCRYWADAKSAKIFLRVGSASNPDDLEVKHPRGAHNQVWVASLLRQAKPESTVTPKVTMYDGIVEVELWKRGVGRPSPMGVSQEDLARFNKAIKLRDNLGGKIRLQRLAANLRFGSVRALYYFFERLGFTRGEFLQYTPPRFPVTAEDIQERKHTSLPRLSNGTKGQRASENMKRNSKSEEK